MSGLAESLFAMGTGTILLVFLSLFTITGAASLGKALRDLVLEPGREGMDAWSIVTGIIFLVASLFIGANIADNFRGSGMRFMGLGFVPLQLLLIAVVVGLTFVLNEALAPILKNGDILFGAGFLVVGVGVLGFMIRSGDARRGMAFPALFIAIGAAILGRALWKMSHGELPE